MEYSALCKLRGMLVIAVFTPTPVGKTAKCPDCRNDQFRTYQGWVECIECGFAILEAHYERMMKRSGEQLQLHYSSAG